MKQDGSQGCLKPSSRYATTPKLNKGEQSFLHGACCLNLTYIAIMFHHDIPKPYIVIEWNRIALQTATVYFFFLKDL